MGIGAFPDLLRSSGTANVPQRSIAKAGMAMVATIRISITSDKPQPNKAMAANALSSNRKRRVKFNGWYAMLLPHTENGHN